MPRNVLILGLRSKRYPCMTKECIELTASYSILFHLDPPILAHIILHWLDHKGAMCMLLARDKGAQLTSDIYVSYALLSWAQSS